MSPPSADSGPLSDVFKVKITNVIQEQLKPIIAELASQQEALLTHLALLKHNHNVNDYQMNRLENIRNLEQSINFKVTGALGFCPWQHPSMGTNLREPVPADPLKIPQFVPVDSASRAERATTSTALIKEAGVSARRLGVPLTMQDFPRDPVGHKAEDSMHSSVPLFGLGAPRWRTAEGLPDHDEPGTAAYDGVLAKPQGKKGLMMWDSCAKKKKMKRKPMYKLVEEGKVPYGTGVPPPSSSSIRRAGTSLLEALDVPMREPRDPSFDHSASSSETTDLRTPPAGAAYTGAPSSAPAGTGLNRSDSMETIATMATFGSTDTPSSPLPPPPPLRRSNAMAHIGPLPEITGVRTETTLEQELHKVRTTIQRAAAERKEKEKEKRAKARSESAGDIDVRSTTATTSSLSRASTMATIGSSPPSSPTVSRKTTSAKIAKAKSTRSTSKAKAKVKAKAKTQTTRPVRPQRRKRASAAASASTPSSVSSVTVDSSTSTASPIITPSSPKRTLKRARRTTDDDEQEQHEQNREEDEEEDAERPRKRLKRAAAPSPSPSIVGRVRRGSAAVMAEEEEDSDSGDRAEHTSSHSEGQGQVRRSTRVARASAVTGASASARRGQTTKAKKTKN